MMKALKKYLGIVWIILGPAAMALLTWQAWEKINLAKAGIETSFQKTPKKYKSPPNFFYLGNKLSLLIKKISY
jgi:hypothetical protein